MSKSLFAKKNRQEASLKHKQESFFEFLDRSIAPQAESARKLLDDCTERFAKANLQRAEYLLNKCQKSDEDFFSAGFELLMYSSLLSDQFEAEIAPLSDHSCHNPTFLVHAPSGESFYLDCMTFSTRPEDAIKELVLDTLKKTSHKQFMVSTDFHGFSDGTIPDLTLLQNAILSWLNSLDPAAVEQRLAHNELVSFGHKLSDHFFIELSALPRSPFDQHTDSILCTDLSPLTHTVQSISPTKKQLRRLVKRKANQHAELNKPYVLALSPSTYQHIVSFDHMLDTLYGDVITFTDSQGGVKKARKPNGVWSRHSLNEPCTADGFWFFQQPYDVFNTDYSQSHFFIDDQSPHQETLCNALTDFEHLKRGGMTKSKTDHRKKLGKRLKP